MILSGTRFGIRALKAVAKNATATLTADELGKGLITSTSAAATSLTLPLASDLSGLLKPKRGDILQFIVDNSAGASVVTVVVNTGIVVAPALVAGDNLLTVAVGSVGHFLLYFKTVSTAIVYRKG